jgi:hypothetical protein
MKYVKIHKVKIVLFYLVEHKSNLFPGLNKIESTDKNMRFHKHSNQARI